MLSETDIEALDFVIQEFGSMTQWQLRDYTHKYPEWHQHEGIFNSARKKREAISNEELLSLLDNDPLTVPEEHLKESWLILTGNFD
ncbi:hypothetical protein MBAV_003406 [Candidatus Magnetobacterium bavaricum]|uniref:Antitoxin SocA-like Panacea domain-containing protein n=2 Tax=Candidatus Magnetobacterium bavaricum TaxID=29290 RepID=A0A0F3GR78_9BACT|nr:hypothetical protein MBAV_003406 [Candidatus Magnetobacterium bavaricum]